MSRTVHLSARIPARLARDLDQVAASLRVSRSQAAIRILEEGVRMARCPGIDFRSRATGRSAFVTGTGLGVWEIDMLWVDHGRDRKRLLRNYPHLTAAQLEAGLRYAEAYSEEIEDERRRAQPDDPTALVPGLKMVPVR